MAALLIAAAAALPASAGAGGGASGAVYTLTNGASGNSVLVFARDGAGGLTPAGSFSTGGLGSGGSLGSQGALVLSEHGKAVYAVNAGSNDISAFEVKKDELTLVTTVGSGGAHPISLTVADDLLYVVNAGGVGMPANIVGFTIGHHGLLSPLAGSSRPLSGNFVGPAQIEFDAARSSRRPQAQRRSASTSTSAGT